MTAFSTALYYPCISAPSETWLKNAILYWDQIQTIVPDRMKHPYEDKTALTLYDRGILQPLFVHSEMPEILQLGDEVLEYLDSPEGKALLNAPKKNRRRVRMAASKGSVRLLSQINEDKLADKLKRLAQKPPSSLNGWLHVDERFANYYMTLLATRLSDNRGFGLLSDMEPVDKFALVAKLDSYTSENQTLSKDLAQGMLANLIIKRIDVDPETPVTTLLRFREKYSDELGFFRSKIGELTSGIESDEPALKLTQRISDIYTNGYIPGFNDLKRALRGRRIKFAVDSVLKVAFFSVTATSLPLTLGIPLVHALAAGAAVSLTACAVTYNSEKRDKISQSPYLYLLKAEKKFRKRRK